MFLIGLSPIEIPIRKLFYAFLLACVYTHICVPIHTSRVPGYRAVLGTPWQYLSVPGTGQNLNLADLTLVNLNLVLVLVYPH